MKKTDLKIRAQVATDLFERGAAKVRIADSEIEVDWRDYTEAVTGSAEPKPQQNVNVSVHATATAQSDSASSLSAVFKEIEKKLPEYDIDPKAIPEAKTKLKTLQKELEQKSPKWDVIKKVLSWALNFSKDLFLRLIVIIVEQQAKGQSPY